MVEYTFNRVGKHLSACVQGNFTNIVKPMIPVLGRILPIDNGRQFALMKSVAACTIPGNFETTKGLLGTRSEMVNGKLAVHSHETWQHYVHRFCLRKEAYQTHSS